MGRSAEAEEAVGLRIGIEVQRFDLVDPRGDQAMDDIGFKIELRLAVPTSDEEARIVAVGFQELVTKACVDFVGRQGDAWTDGGVDMLTPRTQALHRRDGRVGYACESAAPAGRGRPD